MKILKMKLKKLVSLKEVERRQLKQAMKESREIAWRSAEGYARNVRDSSSQPSRS